MSRGRSSAGDRRGACSRLSGCISLGCPVPGLSIHLEPGDVQHAAGVARPGGAEPADRVQMALSVLLTVLTGGPLTGMSGLPGGSDDLVADAIDNLGFGTEDAGSAGDLAFADLGHIREVMDQAEYAELERARDLAKTVMAYAQTLAFVGSRTDRSLRWPAYSLVYGRVISAAGDQLPLCLPFAAAARRQYGPGWDDHVAALARHAEAVASLLRALPRKLYRLVRADGTPVRPSSRQLDAFQAAYRPWAEQHPELAQLLLHHADKAQKPHPGHGSAVRQDSG